MGRPRKTPESEIRAAQDTGEDGFEDLPPPSFIPAERKISGTRKEAIERGRLLGEDESTRRRLDPGQRSLRVKRAMAYAAWEYDGKPDGVDYPGEFGFSRPQVMASLDREEKK